MIMKQEYMYGSPMNISTSTELIVATSSGGYITYPALGKKLVS